MKKGLLSILAGALLVVGCQNYDDQFDQLESQISALSSTVAGLSQVQSDLASLAGTVSSLASTVNGLGSQIDTAVANGLADIQADITAIEAAVADVASSDEVSDLADAVAASQEDLDQLLANGSIFQNDVVINSAATLDVYAAMGSGINIVNGKVDIDSTSDMDMTKLQTVVDNILTTTKEFSYNAGTGVDDEITFNNLTGTMTLTVVQKGGYEFKALKSATVISLTDAASVDIVHLGALVSVTSLSDGSAAGTFQFDKASELHLTSLPRYSGGLSLKVKKGGVIALTAFKDVATDGTAAANQLTIDGPASMTIANLSGDKSGSTLTLNNVATAVVNGYDGSITVGAGVENFTSDNVVAININSADDLETLSITGALDPNATTTDTAGPDISIDSDHSDLVTATFAGVLGSIDVASAANLETLTISADLNGDYIDIDGNNDLTSIVVTGAKIGNVTINANTDLETLVMDHTTDLASADTGAAVSITANTNLTSLTWSADDVDSLTVTGNTQLATVNFTGLKDLGTSTTATADIQNNDIDASLAADSHQTTGTLAAGTDTGKFTTTSGIETLQTWLDAALAVTGAKSVQVYFDEVTAVTKQTVADGTFGDVSHTDGYTSAKYNAIAYSVTSAVVGETIRETKTWVMDGVENSLNAQNTAVASTESVTLSLGGVSVDFGSSASINTISSLVTAIDGASNWGTDYTITAAQDAYKRSIQKVTYLAADGSTAATVHTAGNLYFTFGTTSGTIALSAGDTNLDIVQALATAISATSNGMNKWNASANGDDEIIVYNTVSVTGYPSNLGTGGAAFPTLSFTVDAAQSSTTAVLSANVSNTAGSASRTYFLSAAKNDITGVRITVKNNSQSTAGTFSTPAENLANLQSVTALVSGTNTIGTYSIIAPFTAVANASGGVTTTVDRTSWLGS